MDAEHQQPHPPVVDREQDAQFLIKVDTALDRHRKYSEPPPPNVHETVIHTQAPTPDAGAGAPATAPAGEAKYDTLPRPIGIGSAATPQFFGAGGPMCVALFLIQIVSDLSVPGPTRMRRFDETTLQSRKASRPSSPPPAIVGIGNKGTWSRPCRRSTLLGWRVASLTRSGQLRDRITQKKRLSWPWSVWSLRRIPITYRLIAHSILGWPASEGKELSQ